MRNLRSSGTCLHFNQTKIFLRATLIGPVRKRKCHIQEGRRFQNESTLALVKQVKWLKTTLASPKKSYSRANAPTHLGKPPHSLSTHQAQPVSQPRGKLSFTCSPLQPPRATSASSRPRTGRESASLHRPEGAPRREAGAGKPGLPQPPGPDAGSGSSAQVQIRSSQATTPLLGLSPPLN